MTCLGFFREMLLEASGILHGSTSIFWAFLAHGCWEGGLTEAGSSRRDLSESPVSSAQESGSGFVLFLFFKLTMVAI